jgi:small subunit ribosomal protein S19e
MGIHDVPKTDLIERAAKELQQVQAVQPPQWALFAKTGACKERQPTRDDWWFVRTAAVLRRLSAAQGPIGVQKLRTLYGGKKNRGHAPERFYKGSGSIIRKMLQQLDKAGFTKKIDKGLHKGRLITPQGLSFLGKIADAYMKEKNIVLPKRPEGELHILELPKEKPAKKPRVRKKADALVAEAPSAAPEAQAAPAPAAEAKPKRPRAPRKKKAGAAPAPEAAPAAPAPAKQKAAEPAPSQPANQ